ncbi:hypothetical protein [Amycolatopsis nigrescens]|uniref:hypothetical protein n=1 Tax=Amycolatopsis nigrescens TaxID=381445 RepID=UPI000381E1CE|nr:hypothetical protein [Amycolatopsis nigrescens]
MTEEPDGEPEVRTSRADFRAFVRKNHPDVGGDPEEFMAGLARYREAERSTVDTEDAEDLSDDARFDAPLTFVTTPRGVSRAVAGAKRWRQRRRRPPRVQ